MIYLRVTALTIDRQRTGVNWTRRRNRLFRRTLQGFIPGSAKSPKVGVAAQKINQEILRCELLC
jgi:hypothetical protein